MSDDYTPMPLDDALRILLKVPPAEQECDDVPEPEEDDESAGDPPTSGGTKWSSS